MRGQKNGKGDLSMAKRGENIRKRKDDRYEACLVDYYIGYKIYFWSNEFV